MNEKNGIVKLRGILPESILDSAENISREAKCAVGEIRLRRNGKCSVTVGGRNKLLHYPISEDEFDRAFRALCSYSVYAHEETACEGYISSRSGFRVGICGRANIRRGEVISVGDISSLNIRIPGRVPGCADGVYSLMSGEGFSRGLLVWSRPGIGKTTFLREMAYRMATGENPVRVAVVDTRNEICEGLDDTGIMDILSSYPRAKGIEIATRTLSAQAVICDEISGAEDVAAVLKCRLSGICVITSAHAQSFEDVLETVGQRELYNAGVFGTYCGLISQKSGGYETDIKRTRRRGDV